MHKLVFAFAVREFDNVLFQMLKEEISVKSFYTLTQCDAPTSLISHTVCFRTV